MLTEARPERIGYIAMPLVRNAPTPRNGWRETVCPECGTSCWSDPAKEMFPKSIGMIPVCTLCTLKKGGLHALRHDGLS